MHQNTALSFHREHLSFVLVNYIIQSNKNKALRAKEQLSTLLGPGLESMSDDDFKTLMNTMQSEDRRALFALISDAVNGTGAALSYEMTQALSKVLGGDKKH
jgi:hypothetical protein